MELVLGCTMGPVDLSVVEVFSVMKGGGVFSLDSFSASSFVCLSSPSSSVTWNSVSSKIFLLTGYKPVARNPPAAIFPV